MVQPPYIGPLFLAIAAIYLVLGLRAAPDSPARKARLRVAFFLGLAGAFVLVWVRP